MDKFNKWFEKYYAVLWILVAAIWFFVEYFFKDSTDPNSLLWDGIIWVAFAIEEYIRISIKKK